jgi:Glycosyltransferase family 87
MQLLFFKQPAAILLLAALTLILFTRGIVPGTSRIDTDFPNYLTAARIVADGGQVERLYDNSWFQEQMRRYGIGKPSEGKFAPFPPPTALLMVPLARLEPLDALRIMTGVSIVCLFCSIILLMRILSWNFVDTAVFTLLSGYALLNALRFGQPYVLVSASCILGYYLYGRGRPLLSGMCLGLFTPLKYFPIVILIYFAFRRQWKVVLGGAIAIFAVATASIGILGWKVHAEFLSAVLGNHLLGNLSMQDPFATSFQSFDALLRQLFIFDARSNPQPLIAAPALQGIGVLITKASILLVTLATLVKLARGDSATAIAPSIGILGILVLLLAPATATYHFVLLWLPVGLLIAYFLRERVPVCAYIILALYALIGFFPYGMTARFAGRGGLAVLAYPRLLLLLTMFVASVYFIWHSAASEQRAHDSPTVLE